MRLRRCGNTFCFVLSRQLNTFVIALWSLLVYTKSLMSQDEDFFRNLAPDWYLWHWQACEKKWREREKRIVLSKLYKAASRQAGIHWILEVSRICLQAYRLTYKQALQNYSERQFQSITDLAAAFFSHTKIYSHLAVVIYNAWCLNVCHNSSGLLTGSFTAFMRSITIQKRRYTDDKYWRLL